MLSGSLVTVTAGYFWPLHCLFLSLHLWFYLHRTLKDFRVTVVNENNDNLAITSFKSFYTLYSYLLFLLNCDWMIIYHIVLHFTYITRYVISMLSVTEHYTFL